MGSDYPSGYINYTISIYIKDGRYKYEITNFHHTGKINIGIMPVGNSAVKVPNIPDYGPCESMINTKKKSMGMSYQKTFNYYLDTMDKDITSLISSLNESMVSTSNKANENW